MHLLAAQLNFAAGAEVCQAALDAAIEAEQLLCSIGFNATGRYLRPKNKLYSKALCLAACLDSYNNGNLCPNGTCNCSNLRPVVFSQDDVEINSYPNPFSNLATIEFIPNVDGQAILEIYSFTGKKVAELFNGNAIEGVVRNVEFNATDVAPGIYMVKLTIDGNSYYHKITLVR